MTASNGYFDIIIVGGGAVGSCMALAVKQLINNTLTKPLQIAIVEAQIYSPSSPESENQSGFDSRAIALAHQSLGFLETLGLRSRIHAVSEAISDIHVSDKGALGQCELSAAALQVPELGRVIELHELGSVLQAHLRGDQPSQHSQDGAQSRSLNDSPNSSLNNITWFCPDSVQHIEQQAEHAVVQLASGQSLTGALVLLTDGSGGTRALLNLPVEKHVYEQVAMVTTVATSLPHKQRAFERFTEHGPIAMLPMTQNRCSVVWTLPENQQQFWLNASDETCIAGLQKAFGYRLGTITKIGKRVIYPLALQRVSADHLHRIAVLGNAAQTLHPIAGQGFNLGLRDVQVMSQLLRQQLKLVASKQPSMAEHSAEEQQGKADYSAIGDFRLLRKYRQLRAVDANKVVSATHGLVHLFSNRSIPLQALRNAGLLAMQFSPQFKDSFAQQFMGQVFAEESCNE